MSAMYAWLIFGLIAAVAVGLTYGVMHAGYTFFAPHTRRLLDRDTGPKKEDTSFTLDYRPCCPPGLGHNESGPTTHCRRTVAQKVATAEQIMKLDHAWSEYNRDPNAVTLSAWETYRDDVIETAFLDMSDDDERRQLLLNNPTRVIEAPTDGYGNPLRQEY